MSIVCGTDFSTPAALAAVVAARLAAQANEPLILVHAVDELGAEADFAAGREAAYEPLRRRLSQESARLRALGAEVREVFAPGFPDQMLACVAAEEAARLIVVASVGARSPDAWLLGSIPERLALTASTPVLVVRGRTPWEEWLNGTHRLQVVAGVDDGFPGEAVARFLPELCGMGVCDVNAARIAWPPGERLRLGVDWGDHPGSLPPETVLVLERELARRVGRLPETGTLKLVVSPGHGRVDQHLLQLAEGLGADLMVVGTHRRTGVSRLWHGSVSRAILRHAPMSVLVVPALDLLAEQPAIRPWHTILATTDGSPLSDRAIASAYAALTAGSRVHLLTVIEIEPASDEALADARRHLADLVPPDAKARGIRTEIHVIEDHAVARAISAAAERWGVDALCMSTHGRTGLSAALAGSVASEVLATSRRPVILVRTSTD